MNHGKIIILELIWNYDQVEVKQASDLTSHSLGVLDDSITSLPIYLNPYSYDFNEQTQKCVQTRLALTNQEIKDTLAYYASKLDMDSYEINYSDLFNSFVLSNDQIELEFNKNNPRTIAVRLQKSYFEEHPQFDLKAKTDEEAYQIIDDFYQYYQDLFDFDSVQYHIQHIYNKQGGEYSYSIYDTSNSSVDNLVSSSQYSIYLWSDEHGKLTQFTIPMNRLKDYYLQDEEIISKEEAIQYFRDGKSTAFSKNEDLLKNIHIATTELVYRYYDEKCEFILPYYLTYTKLSDWDSTSVFLNYVSEGYTLYYRVFVPALRNAYEVSFDSWNNDYASGNEWYFYAKDDEDIQNQYYCNGDATQLRVYQDYYRLKENEPFSEFEMNEQVIKTVITYLLNEITNQYPVINYDQEMKLYEATIGKYTISLDNHLPEYYIFKVAEDEFGLSKAKTLDEAYNALKQFYHRYQGLWGCGDEVKYYIEPMQENIMNYSILLPGYNGVEGKKLQFWVLEDQVSVTIPTGLEDSLDVLIGSYPVISKKECNRSF